MVALAAVAVLAVAIRRLAKRNVMAAFVVVALIGGAAENGVVKVPSLIATPVSHVASGVRSWQHSVADRYVCRYLVAQGTEQATDRAAQRGCYEP